MKRKIQLLIALLAVCCFPKDHFGQTLGTAADFALFSRVGAVSNVGANTHVTGHVGTNSGSSTGFGNVNGQMHDNDAASAQASTDVLALYNELNGIIPTFFPAPLLGNGQILIPGVYSIAAPASLSNDLILDAQGDPNAVFVIQINGALTTMANSSVQLINGARAMHVFWKTEGLVDMASGTVMKGTVVVNNSAITINSGSELEGRALTTTGALTITNSLVYVPSIGAPVLTGPAAPALGTTACYALFSADGPVTNSGVTYVVGDIGTNNGLTTGYNALFVTGTIHPIPDVSTGACAADLMNVYTYLEGLAYDIELLYPAQFGNNLVLTPHTYLMSSAVTLIDTLYLDALGNSSAVFVIRTDGAFSTSVNSRVILLNGAQSDNVFWEVDGAVDINDNSIFEGTIVVNNAALDLSAGVTLNGRGFTTNGALLTTAVMVTMPVGCGAAAPAITSEPVNQAVCEGDAVSFTVMATGTNLTYQWRKGNSDLVDDLRISGATTNTLTIDPVLISDGANDYYVVVSGTYPPNDTSIMVTLTVNTAPAITAQPADQFVCPGDAATFTVTATGAGLTYQWRRGVVDIVDDATFSGSGTATLTVDPVTLATAGTDYNVVVTGTCASAETSSNAALNINAAPAITTQPTDEVACEGTSVSFSVAAIGGGLNYQWKNGAADMVNGPTVSGATAATLTINPISSGDASVNYFVEVTNCAGTATSSPQVSLSVNTAPVITMEPANQVICSGDSVSFVVAATGTNISYQWRRGAVDLVDDGTITGAGTDTLTIDPANLTHTGNDYNVVLTGTCAPSDTSVNVSLTVNTTSDILVQPVSQSVCEGGTVSFTVTASGVGPTYQWRNGSSDVVDGVTISGSNTNTLTINPATTAHASNDYYVVIGSCSPNDTSDHVALVVNTAPVITLEPISETVCAGDSVSFVVNATGSGISYQWYKGLVPVANTVTISGATNDTLTFDPVATVDTGADYYVVLSGACAPDDTSAIVALTVNTAPNIVLQPVSQAVCEGSAVSFTVTDSGIGITYQWRKGASDVTDGPTISGSTSNTLTIGPVTLADASADYYVVAASSCSPNDTSDHVALVVNTAPVITLEPISQTACSGDSVSFVVNATGSGISYQWYKGLVPVVNTVSISGATNDTLTFDPAATTDTGADYYVIMSGACAPDDTSAIVALTVNTAPNIVTQPVSQTVCDGSAVNFSVTATGIGITYQWMKGTSSITDNITVSGSTTSSLTISPVVMGDAGDYFVIVGGCTPHDTSDVVTLTINPIPAVTATSNSPVCLGHPIELGADSITGATYSWTGPLAFTSTQRNPVIPVAASAHAGDYDVTMTVDGCTSVPATATVVVSTSCEADLGVTKTVDNATPFEGDEIIFTITVTNNGPNDATGVMVSDQLQSGYTYQSADATTGSYNPATGLWTIGDLDNGDSETLTIVVQVGTSGNYTNTATVSGNETDPQSANDVATVETNPTDFNIPEGFSPNGDGINDVFVIRGISHYPENTINVFNRWGDVVYEMSNYRNTWDGTSSRGGMGIELLPVGTYFYVLDLGDGSDVFKGTIYLNR